MNDFGWSVDISIIFLSILLFYFWVMGRCYAAGRWRDRRTNPKGYWIDMVCIFILLLVLIFIKFKVSQY